MTAIGTGLELNRCALIDTCACKRRLKQPFAASPVGSSYRLSKEGLDRLAEYRAREQIDVSGGQILTGGQTCMGKMHKPVGHASMSDRGCPCEDEPLYSAESPEHLDRDVPAERPSEQRSLRNIEFFQHLNDCVSEFRVSCR